MSQPKKDRRRSDEHLRRIKLGKAIAKNLVPICTHAEIAKAVGLTAVRVRQLEAEILAKVAVRLAKALNYEGGI